MKRRITKKIRKLAWTQIRAAGVVVLGYILYNQGQADAIHKIYQRGGWVVLPSDSYKNAQYAD